MSAQPTNSASFAPDEVMETWVASHPSPRDSEVSHGVTNGESRPARIPMPATPITSLEIANQCRTIEVWAETCTSVEELREADHRLAAIAEYVKRTSTEGRAKVEAARRRLEVRIGQLLGPAKAGNPTGANQHRGTSSASEVPPAEELTPNERSQFRKMADHPELVDAVIDDSDDETPASRRRVLDEINRAHQASAPEPPSEEAPKQRRAPLPEAASRAGWELRKCVERIERILADDRLTSNHTQVAAQLRPHLMFADQALPGLIGALTNPEQEPGNE